MEILDLKQLVKNISDKELRTPILLVGVTGIGKSQSMQQVAKEMGIGFIDLRLATQEVTDLIGIPRTVEVDKEVRTYWTKPIWFPKEGTKGILALEEVNRAPEDVRQAIFQLLTEWKLHTHELPKGWIIVSMINPSNGNYHVNQLDPAFRRRFIQVIVNPPDVTDWCVWAIKNKVDDAVVRFVGMFPKLLSKNDSIEIEATPTPAGYDMLSCLIINKVIPDKCLHEVASGIIGTEAATTFISSLKSEFEKPITAEQILSDYSKVKERHLKLKKDKRNDLLYFTMVDIIATLEDKKLAKEDIQGLAEYLMDCPAETLTTIILRVNDKVLEKLADKRYSSLVTKVDEIKNSVKEL